MWMAFIRRCSIKAVLKSFAIFTRKHLCWSLLCWSLFLIKLQTFRPAILWKRDSNTGTFPVNIAKHLRTPLLKNTSFEEHLWTAAMKRSSLLHLSNENLIHSKSNICWVQQNYNYDSFLKDQMKCKSDPSFYQLLIEKSQIRGKNEVTRFFQTNDHYFLFLNGEINNFLKSKDFLPNTILFFYFTFKNTPSYSFKYFSDVIVVKKKSL